MQVPTRAPGRTARRAHHTVTTSVRGRAVRGGRVVPAWLRVCRSRSQCEQLERLRAPAGESHESRRPGCAIVLASRAASPPTPNSSDDLRVRRKCTPQKKSPGTSVLRSLPTMGNPSLSKPEAVQQRGERPGRRECDQRRQLQAVIEQGHRVAVAEPASVRPEEVVEVAELARVQRRGPCAVRRRAPCGRGRCAVSSRHRAREAHSGRTVCEARQASARHKVDDEGGCPVRRPPVGGVVCAQVDIGQNHHVG